MQTVLEELPRQDIRVAQHLPDAVLALSALPFPAVAHKDPFDRVIAATVIADPNYRLISADAIFDHYGITRIW